MNRDAGENGAAQLAIAEVDASASTCAGRYAHWHSTDHT
jgi:hypothetical protein